VIYSYDNGRRRSGLNLQAPNTSDWVQTYGYDNAGRLSSLTSPAGTFTYSYQLGLDSSFPSPSALVRKLALPNGAYITNNFDDYARILSTTLKNSTNAVLNSHAYAYNELNQRTTQTRTAGDSVSYTYDSLMQLAAAQAHESNGTMRAHEQFSYGYDVA
jgi:YD repeat-containing protein